MIPKNLAILEESTQTKTVMPDKKLAGQTLEHESLILAQDERWRRA